MAKITVYTKDGCPQCVMTKTVLKEEGIEFEEINVEEDQAAFEYVANELNIRQMPVVVAEGQEPFSGFRPDRLKELK